MRGLRFLLLLLLPSLLCVSAREPERSLAPRWEASLNEGWRSMLSDAAPDAPLPWEGAAPTMDGRGRPRLQVAPEAAETFDDSAWQALSVPHSWDRYHGFTGRKHGNLHGTAWYRRHFEVPASASGRAVFIFFEGVGSFAEIWVNGQPAGFHAGGLTCLSLDVSALVRPGSDNVLAVRASHPAGIRSLPWVCGGCERAYGFSEGSQPFGIHRAVRIIITDTLRIVPFGVHVWNDTDTTSKAAVAQVRAELRNGGDRPRRFLLRHSLLAPDGSLAGRAETRGELAAGAESAPLPSGIPVTAPRLWNPGAPVLYTLRTEVLDPDNGSLLDSLETPFGFRVVSWPTREAGSRATLLINGRPVFLNGTCEYQHQLGGSHAFAPEMVQARVNQMTAAGFNAFRDAHHPHDLRYNAEWDSRGLAWWTQFGAHIWFDRADFRQNFRQLLTEWVRERRNSPSLILWGLQNESMLPEDFARKCTELIRSLDPTSPSQRLVTTCNGGRGTDWDVPQNWTGTYGGDPATYAEDLRSQVLVGEYGAWRSLGLGQAGEQASQLSGYSEEAMEALLGTKLRLGRAAAGWSVGHFQWIFATHENPGRNAGSRGEQIADGWSRLDRVGPANNKGLLTLWGEPLDVWYLYRTHSVPLSGGATILIAGASRPDRWTAPGQARDVTVYSNCDEVELLDGPDGLPLGRLSRPPDGAPFLFRAVSPSTRVLQARGLAAGRVAATDTLLLHHLPEAPARQAARATEPDTLAPRPGLRSLLRVNVGGPALTDSHGRAWEADRDWTEGADWGIQSWASAFTGLDPALGSLRRVNIPVSGTRDEALYQDFRYGRSALALRFRLPDGDYLVDLHFAEPWYGRGGGIDARGWRLFDVALNGETRLRNLDLFSEAGFGRALVKTLPVTVRGGRLEISFPRCAANQALLCAVEILAREDSPAATAHRPLAAKLPAQMPVLPLAPARPFARFDTGMSLYSASEAGVAVLPDELVGTECLRPAGPDAPLPAHTLARASELFLAVPRSQAMTPPAGWIRGDNTLSLAGEPARTFELWLRSAPAGEFIDGKGLPPGSALFLKPTLPSPPAQALTGLRVEGLVEGQDLASGNADWQLLGSLRQGTRPQGPAGPALTVLPTELGDADWLRTPQAWPAGARSVRFQAGDHLELVVGLDARITQLPGWLAEWTPHAGKASLGGQALQLWRRRVDQGTLVELGANPPLPDGSTAPMYCVFARLSRPVQRLSLSQALPFAAAGTPSGSQETSTPSGARDEPPLAHPGDSLLWRFEVGVGDRYFLVPRLRPQGAATLRAELLDKEGKVLCETTHELTAGDLPGRLRIRSCSSINAGTYRARFTLLKGAPVAVDSLAIE